MNNYQVYDRYFTELGTVTANTAKDAIKVAKKKYPKEPAPMVYDPGHDPRVWQEKLAEKAREKAQAGNRLH